MRQKQPQYILAPFFGNDGIDKFLSKTLDSAGVLVEGGVDAVTGATEKELAKQQSVLQQTVLSAQIDAQRKAIELQQLNQQRLALEAQAKATAAANVKKDTMMYIAIGFGALILLGATVLLILNVKSKN